MSLRRPILITFGVLALSVSVAIGVFVYTFDLNRYRLEIAQRLATSLDRPVQLGEARLSLRPGLALSFADLRIGSGESGGDELSADHLILLIDPRPLLKRKLLFEEIVLDSPRLTVTLDTGKDTPSEDFRTEHDLLKTALIHTLRIENGAFRLRDRRDLDRPVTYDFRSIRGQLADLSLDRPWRVDLSADLVQGDTAAPFTIKGEIAPPEDLVQRSETRLDLNITAQRLDPTALLALAHLTDDTVKTGGTLSLQLALTGTPASGLQLEGAVTGAGFSFHLPLLYRAPLLLHQAAITTTWTAGTQVHAFTDLALKLDALSVHGNVALRRQPEGLWLEGELSTPVLATDDVLPFLPDHESMTLLKENLSGGTLRLHRLQLAGHPEQFRRFDENFPAREGNLAVRDAAFRSEQAGFITEIVFDAAWKDRHLVLHDGAGVAFESPFEFSGSLEIFEQGDSEIELRATGTASAEDLITLVPEDKRADILLDGAVPLSLELAGSFEHLLVDLQADLKNLTGRFADKFTKPSGLPGSLFATGVITPGRLELSHGRLSIPPLEMRVRGAMERAEGKTFSLDVDIAPLDLRKARFRTPLLERFAPEGEIAVHYKIEGSAGKILQRGGRVSLRGFGIHLPDPVGDISQANGEILLRKTRAETSGLTARLGASLVVAKGTLENYSDPRLELWVKSQAIRANDLIFPSDQTVLRDVDGHLVITREGIEFAPVTVGLDGGTRATIRGSLRNFKSPKTRLRIVADYGNIDEVIALWRRPDGAAPKGSKARSKGELFIDVRIREGVLGPLHFQDALGEITLHEGVLNIFPLRFSAGSGSCTGQVVVDNRDGSPLLKISGHMEDIDAAALHHELLKRRGLITGVLSGDFYLEGRAGSEFLDTSIGGFDLKVRDGVLLKFRFLSRVFSLLNFSQILAFQLPDMDQKGMPFERLTGTFSLLNGVLTTEDLFIKSNAMNLSLVGDADLVRGKVDMTLGVKPLRTVDKVITQIPIAGWLLTGEEKALITAHFQIRGKSDDPEVVPIPITSVSEKVLGIFKRVLELPGKVITDTESVLGGGKGK